jgi:hypothetical protein
MRKNQRQRIHGSTLSHFIQSIIISIVVLSGMAGCNPANIPIPIALPTENSTEAPPAIVSLPPTNTPVPTATKIAKTATTIPTLGILTDGFSGWCIAQGAAISTEWGSGDYKMLGNARPGKMIDGVLNVLAPAAYCTFVYTFNQAVPPGFHFSIFAQSNPKPFFTTELIQGADNPNIGYVVPKHTMAYNPDFWDVTVQFVLLDSDNQEIRRDNVRIYKILPPLCWDGSLPNPVDLQCPVNDR